MKKLVSYAASFAMVGTSIALSVPASAGTAPGMGDLIDMRGSSLDNAMGQRGYKFARKVAAASMYWNDSQKACVSAVVDNGRVASIETASASDCGKSGGGNGAAVAVGAVALVGLAALLAGRHKDNNSNSEAAYSRAHDRGYDDGLHGRRFQRGQADGYHAGYLAGERYRGVPHRDHSAVYVPGAPRQIQDACKRRADTFFGAVPGVSRPVSADRNRQGNYDIVTSTHKVQARCSVDGRGYISDFRKRD